MPLASFRKKPTLTPSDFKPVTSVGPDWSGPSTVWGPRAISSGVSAWVALRLVNQVEFTTSSNGSAFHAGPPPPIESGRVIAYAICS